MSTVTRQIAAVEFQADARQANQAIESMRLEADKCNKKIELLQDRLSKGIKTIKIEGRDTDVEKEIKNQQRLARSYNDAAAALMKGVKAWDELWKHAKTGDIEALTGQQIKAGINGAKRQYDRLILGDEEDRRKALAIKDIVDQANIVLDKLKGSTNEVIQTLNDGGHVADEVLQREKKYLEDMLGLTEKFSPEWQDYNRQLQDVNKYIAQQAAEEKRLRGELVDANDARREAEKLDQQRADAAKKEHEAQQKIIDDAKTVLQQREDELRLHKENAQKKSEEIARQDQLINKQNEVVESVKRENREINKKSGSLNKAAREADNVADRAKRAADKSAGEVNKLALKLADAEGKVRNVQEQLDKLGKSSASSRNATLEQLQKDADAAIHKVWDLKDRLEKIKTTDYTDQKRISQLNTEIDQLEKLIAVSDKYRKQFARMTDEKFNNGFLGEENEKNSTFKAEGYLQRAYRDKMNSRVADVSPDNPEVQEAAKRIKNGILQNAQENYRRAIYEEIKNGKLSPKDIEERSETYKGLAAKATRTGREFGLGKGFIPEADAYTYMASQMEKYLDVAKKVQAEREKMAGSEPYLQAAKTDVMNDIYGKSFDDQKRDRLHQQYTEITQADDKRHREISHVEAQISDAEKQYTEILAKLNEEKKKEAEASKQSASVDKERQRLTEKLNKAKQEQADIETKLNEKTQEAKRLSDESAKANENAAAKRDELNKAQADGNKRLQEESQKLSDLQAKRNEDVNALNKEKEAIKQTTDAANEQGKIIHDAQQKQAQNRQLSIDSIEKAIELLKQENRVIGDETNPQWVENEKTIGRLNQRLSEMKQHAAELRGEAMSVNEAMNLSDLLSGKKKASDVVESKESRVERETAVTRSNIASLDSQINSVNGEVATLQQKMDEIGKRSPFTKYVEDLGDATIKLQEQNTTKQKFIELSQKESDSRKQNIQAQKEQIAAIQRETDEAVNLVNQRIKAQEDTLNELKALNPQTDTFKQMSANLEQEIQKLQEEKAAIENSAETKQRLAEANQKLADLIKTDTTETEKAKSAIESYDKQIAETQAKMNELTSGNRFDASDMKQYAEGLGELRKKYQDLYKARNELFINSTLAESHRRDEINAQREQIAAIERQRQEAINSVDARIRTAKETLKTLNGAPEGIRGTNAYNEMVQNQLRVLVQLQNESANITANAQAKLTQLNAKLAASIKEDEEATAKAKAQLQEYDHQIDAVRKDISEYEDKFKDTKSATDTHDMEEASKQMDELRAKLESLTEERQKYVDQLQQETDAANRVAEAEKAVAEAQEQGNVSIEQMQQAIETLKAAQLTTTDADQVKQYAESIDFLTRKIEEAAGPMMSLRDAFRMGLQGAANTFKGTPEQLKQAKQVLEETLETTEKSSHRYEQLRRALDGIALEEKRVGGVTKEMQAVLDQPKGRSFNELKMAVEQGRKALNDMKRDTTANQKAFDDLAKKVKAADLEMRNLSGESKGTASQFEKAWGRLKTYVTFYVGAAAALQKAGSTVDDLMELSDKMGEVRKTTGFSADEVGRLSDNLSHLDTRTPITELMDLSAAAGQLGLNTQEDVQGFTEAANEMLVALPEMGQDGATQMMKIAIATGEVKKIQKQMQEGTVEGSSATAVAMEKIGSTIDRLRATTAAAAPPIADFVKRVGAVGAQSGISVDQVAALGATVDSLGMGTEMAGTAIARMIPAIKNHAFDISKALGITPDSLRQLFDTGKGMEAVLMVLEKMRDDGMDAKSIESFLGENGMSGLMKDLNQQGARAGIVFAGLSQNVDLLRQNLNTAKQAYQDGTAIQQEYDKMNDTTAAKWERLKNRVEEFFVNDSAQSFLGTLIDLLRKLVDFISDDGYIAIGVRGLILLFATFKMNIVGFLKGALAVFPQMVNGIRLIGVQLGIVKMQAAAADATMKKMQWGNLFTAIATAAIYVAYALSNMKSASKAAGEEMGKARLQIDQAENQFERYWGQINKTSASLNRSQAEHRRLDAEVKRLTSSTNKGSRATAVLSSKEKELRESENKVTRASNEHRIAIANMNAIYGRYLGYLLTDRNYALLAADAHEKIALAIEHEMLAKQQEAAINSVVSKNTEGITENFGDLVKRMTSAGIGNSQAVSLATEAQNFLRTQFHYNKRTGGYSYNPWLKTYLQGKGLNVNGASAQDIAALWFYFNLKGKTNLDNFTISSIAGVGPKGKGTEVRSGDFRNGWTESTPIGATSFRGGFASSYLGNMQEVGITQQVFQNDIDTNNKKTNDNNNREFGKHRNIGLKAINVLVNPKSTKAQRSQAYEDIGNSILGMQNTATGKFARGKIKEFLNKLKHTKGVDYNRALATKDNIAKRISQQKSDVTNPDASAIPTTTPSGHTSTYTPPHFDAGETQPNPWGEHQDASSTDWSKMSGDALVDRRKQMNKFVRALQDDSDVSAVLSEDPALQKAIKEKKVANNADAVIDWYNQQRLAIQKELHKNYLTNTGGWLDPTKKKTKKAKKRSPRKIVNDEISYYLDSLDAYYTDRKSGIEEAQNNGDISEAEAWRRNLLNQQIWQQRRGELQQLYSKKAGGVSSSERNAIYDIIGDRTGETSDMVQANIASTVSFIRQVGTKSMAEMRAIYGDLDLGMEKSFQRMQKAVSDQMSAIKAIVDNERPFNGIIDNLETNITKMGLLQTDLENKRIALEKQGVDRNDKRLVAIDKQEREELPKRLNFLLGEAEHAYEITWDKLAYDMKQNGFGSWLDAILNSEDPDEAKRGMIAQLHSVYDDVQDAVKKESSLVKKQVETTWNDTTLLPNGVSIKNTYQKAIDALGVEENGVNRANQLINAGTRSERVADSLAIKQLQIQLDMQTHYYNLMRQTGLQRIEDLQRAAKEKEKLGKLEEAERLNMDARHAQMSLDLSLSEEETDLAKIRAELQDKIDESQARLYKHLKEWGTLLSSSLQGLFEASNTGAADYYNNLAKMRLTGEGSGGGTYVVIDNAGTKNAKAHYENLDGEEALKRQLEIEQQNAVADEWKKVMDDINKKINDEITDWMNAQLHNQAINDNTKATVENTKALWEIIHGRYQNDVSDISIPRNAPSDSDQTQENATALWTAYRDASIQAQADIAEANAELQSEGGSLAPTLPTTEEQTQQMVENIQTVNQAFADSTIQAQQDIADASAGSGDSGEGGLVHANGTPFATRSNPAGMQEVVITAPYHAAAEASTEATEKIVQNNKKQAQSAIDTDNKIKTSSKNTYSAMASAMNMYGIAYQAMSNENMNSTQKFLTFALQSAGQVAIAMLTTDMFQAEGESKVQLPGIFGKAVKHLGPVAGPIAFAAMTALLGGLMAVATSKVSKSKSQISQVTGASVSAGRLSTGMLTYAKGNVNEFTDPSTLTPGQQYNVDGADGHTYRARYMGGNPTTHLTNGPEFHLVGERGREAIIDANTTRKLQMDDTGIWNAIQTLYNGGSVRSVRRGGMRNFATGNLDDFDDVAAVGVTGTDGSTLETADVVSSLQASLDRNSDVLERAMREGIKGVFDIHGKGGLVDSYDRGKKEAKRHGEKY